MIFTLVTAVQEKLNEIVDMMKSRIEEEKLRKEKEAEEAEKVGKICTIVISQTRRRRRNTAAMFSAGGVPGNGGDHRELPGLESNIWPGNDRAEEKKTEGGGAGKQVQTHRWEMVFNQSWSLDHLMSDKQHFNQSKEKTTVFLSPFWPNGVRCCQPYVIGPSLIEDIISSLNVSLQHFSKSLLRCISPLPGKQLFERDRNLDTSDIQFLEEGNSDLIR